MWPVFQCDRSKCDPNPTKNHFGAERMAPIDATKGLQDFCHIFVTRKRSAQVETDIPTCWVNATIMNAMLKYFAARVPQLCTVYQELSVIAEPHAGPTFLGLSVWPNGLTVPNNVRCQLSMVEEEFFFFGVKHAVFFVAPKSSKKRFQSHFFHV